MSTCKIFHEVCDPESLNVPLRGKYSPKKQLGETYSSFPLIWPAQGSSASLKFLRDSVVLTKDSSRWGALREKGGWGAPSESIYWHKIVLGTEGKYHIRAISTDSTSSHRELWIAHTKGSDAICFSNSSIPKAAWRPPPLWSPCDVLGIRVDNS